MPSNPFTRTALCCLLLLATVTSACAQYILMSTEKGGLYSLDMATRKLERQDYASGWHVGSIALFRGTVYYFNTVDNRLYSITGVPGNRITKPVDSFFVIGYMAPVVAMTTLKDGRLEWFCADGNIGNFRPGYDRDGHVVSQAPASFDNLVSGDIIFYKDSCYGSLDKGIMIRRLGLNYIIIPTTRQFAGLVNVVSTCGGANKVYAVENAGDSVNIVEIDIENRKILGNYCSFTLDSKVVDAASNNETGETNFLSIDNLLTIPACYPDSMRPVRIEAYVPAGDTGLSYTFTKGPSTIGPIRQPGGQFVFNSRDLDAGLWNVHITSSEGCSGDTTIRILPIGKVTADVVVQPDTCGLGKGNATIIVTAAKPPYYFAMSAEQSQFSPVFSGLAQGTYMVKITDSTSCSAKVNFTIQPYNLPGLVADLAITSTTTCGPFGGIKIMYPSYVSQPTASIDYGAFISNTTFSNLAAGQHRLQVKNGTCSLDTTFAIPLVAVSPVSIDSIVTNNTCAGTGNLKLTIRGTEGPYRFEVDGKRYSSGTPTSNLASGNYSATIYNAGLCPVDSVSFTIRPKINCDTLMALYMPSAFTPNGDGKNDILKPLPNIKGSNVVRFVFRVYNRFGQVVFESSSPSNGWDGNYKGIQQQAGVYVWMFEGQESNGKTVVEKGTVVLIR